MSHIESVKKQTPNKGIADTERRDTRGKRAVLMDAFEFTQKQYTPTGNKSIENQSPQVTSYCRYDDLKIREPDDTLTLVLSPARSVDIREVRIT